jgi:hypothetical protein
MAADSRYVDLKSATLFTVDDAMLLIARMPYLALVDLAGLVSGDADKIAEAAQGYLQEGTEDV